MPAIDSNPKVEGTDPSVKQHVLVVDDQPAVRGIIALELKRRGYQVTTAGDGAEAMHAMEELSPDLAVLDLLMPEADGLELLELIKQRHPHVPVIILTGMGYDADSMKQALSRGASAYVSKGLSISHLVMEIHRVLRNSQTGPGV